MIFNFESFKSKMKTSLLLILVLILTTAIPNTYSKYHSNMDASGTANVGEYIVAFGDDYVTEIDLEHMLPGDEINYTFYVTNYNGTKVSDIGIDYFIKIERTNYLPITFTLVKGSDIENVFDVNIESPIYNLPASIETKDYYTLTITWNDEYDDYRYAQMVGSVQLEIITNQIDPR